MANRETLKSYLQYGDRPTEVQWSSLIDSFSLSSELEAVKADLTALISSDTAAINLNASKISVLETTIVTHATTASVSLISSRVSNLEANIGLDSFTFACSAEIGNVSTGTVCTFRMPYDYSLVDVRGALTSASSSGNTSFTVAVNGSTVTSQIDLGVGSKTTYSAGASSSLLGVNSSPVGIVMDSEITVNVSSAGTGASGLKVTLVGALGATTISSSEGNVTFPISFPLGTTLTTIS